MIERKDVMPVNFLKKENFTGSDTGMRYRMEKASKEEETVLKVTVWPEPYGYDATPPEHKRVFSVYRGRNRKRCRVAEQPARKFPVTGYCSHPAQKRRAVNNNTLRDAQKRQNTPLYCA